MTFRGNPPAFSGGDFPADRSRSIGDEPVMYVRTARKATPPTPAPTSVELLADLVQRLADAEKAAEARHAELLAALRTRR